MTVLSRRPSRESVPVPDLPLGPWSFDEGGELDWDETVSGEGKGPAPTD